MGLNIRVYNDIKFKSKSMPKNEIFDFRIVDTKCSKNFNRFGFYNGTELYKTDNISCATYNVLRNSLSQYILGIPAKEVWDNPKPTYPFVELIWFSDCEGGFNTKVCKKLYKDFTDHVYIIEKEVSDDYFKEFYYNLLNLFKLASETKGIVVFS